MRTGNATQEMGESVTALAVAERRRYSEGEGVRESEALVTTGPSRR